MNRVKRLAKTILDQVSTRHYARKSREETRFMPDSKWDVTKTRNGERGTGEMKNWNKTENWM